MSEAAEIIVPIELMALITKSWESKDKEVVMKRYRNSLDIPLLDIYKLFEPSQVDRILTLMGKRTLVKKIKTRFDEIYKEPPLENLNSAYYMVYEKALKQEIKEYVK